jgi:hypothetical protein
MGSVTPVISRNRWTFTQVTTNSRFCISGDSRMCSRKPEQLEEIVVRVEDGDGDWFLPHVATAVASGKKHTGASIRVRGGSICNRRFVLSRARRG